VHAVFDSEFSISDYDTAMEDRIRKALLAHFDSDVARGAELDNLGGHASLRIYWRVHLPARTRRGDSSLIAMVLPQSAAALKSEEGGSSSEPAVTELPFVSVQRYLHGLGVRVPAIDFVDMDLGVLLLEDLGDTMFEDVYYAAPPERNEALYREAIDLLVDFQRRVLRDTERDCICWQKEFDTELLRWELDHYTEWGVDAKYGTQRLDPIRAEVGELYDSIVERLRALPQTLSLRDYQSRNIMRKGTQWVIIDFQDALRGPFVYDLVALLRDSYIELDPQTVHRLVSYYADADLPWCTSAQEVAQAFHLQTVQRKLKDAGRFIFIDRVKENPSFLPYYEPSLGYVRNALRHLPEIGASEVWERGLLRTRDGC